MCIPASATQGKTRKLIIPEHMRTEATNSQRQRLHFQAGLFYRYSSCSQQMGDQMPELALEPSVIRRC